MNNKLTNLFKNKVDKRWLKIGAIALSSAIVVTGTALSVKFISFGSKHKANSDMSKFEESSKYEEDSTRETVTTELEKESKETPIGKIIEKIKANTESKITNEAIPYKKIQKSDSKKVTDFSVKLFKESLNGKSKNAMLSPFSVMSAVSMAANGAKGETLKQMENVLGMNVDTLNDYFHTYAKNLSDNKNVKISNSAWIKKGFSVKETFVKTLKSYYDADVYNENFDSKTVSKINAWVKEKTNGMIEKIIDELDRNARMVLINAITFDAEWQNNYESYNVTDGKFTKENGTKQDVKFMCSNEYTYLEDGNTTGFMKYYKGEKYAFVGLLPKENISINEYVQSLTGDKITSLISNKKITGKMNIDLNVKIPKFEMDFKYQMIETFEKMGLNLPFDSRADFSGISDGSLYISEIQHDTFIKVNETGTKAAAVTTIKVTEGSLPVTEREEKNVILDRPFAYMIWDCENNVPVFMGTVTDLA